jgi:glucose-1-phosphate adenylyltransferase
MRNVISLVLGGGTGTRLRPLTEYRSKPAVPVAGKYRIIDIPISNCINNGLNRIYLLTQFNSVSLHRHIRETYKFDRFDGGFVEILAAQQTLEQSDWYQGTADAVRKNLRCIQQPGIDYVLILSGDQLYRMDFAAMIANHRESQAHVSIAALPVTRQAAPAFGIMRLDDSGRVLGFLEKPQTDEEMDIVRTEPSWIDERGIPSQGRDLLASMGIYLFNRDVLVELLTKSDYQDFGKEVFPMSIRTRRVQVHLYDGYWEDIGTIKSFYEANLALAQPDPPFDLCNQDAPIYTHARFLPPTRCAAARMANSLLSDGCTIEEGAVIENSVIGLRCHVGRNVTIRNSVIMGADFYESDQELAANEREQRPRIGIGDGALIEGAIIDKNCRIGSGVQIKPDANINQDHTVGPVVIRDGVIVVPKESTLADGWKM